MIWNIRTSNKGHCLNYVQYIKAPVKKAHSEKFLCLIFIYFVIMFLCFLDSAASSFCKKFDGVVLTCCAWPLYRPDHFIIGKFKSTILFWKYLSKPNLKLNGK